MKSALLALVALACLACAQTPINTAEPREEKIFRTGSNLPVRDKDAPSDVKVLDPASIDRARGMGGTRAP
jgi:hypothetical protein